jgi:hypothetical protein
MTKWRVYGANLSLKVEHFEKILLSLSTINLIHQLFKIPARRIFEDEPLWFFETAEKQIRMWISAHRRDLRRLPGVRRMEACLTLGRMVS